MAARGSGGAPPGFPTLSAASQVGAGLHGLQPPGSASPGSAERDIAAAFARLRQKLPECNVILATFRADTGQVFKCIASDGVERRIVELLEKHGGRRSLAGAIAQIADSRGFGEILNGLEPGVRPFANPVSAEAFVQTVADDVSAVFAVWKPAEYGLFQPPDHGFIVETVQFVFSLLRIRMHVGVATTAELAESLAQFNVAYLLVDAGLQIVRSNETADALLANEEYIRRSGETLSPVDAMADARLKELVRHFAGKPGQSGAIAMRKTPEGSELVRCVVATARQAAGDILGPPLFAVTFAPGRTVGPAEPAQVRRLGLSAAETELAMDLLKGHTVAQHAAARGIAVATARAHLKRAMMRLGVRRQADLIRHLLSVS